MKKHLTAAGIFAALFVLVLLLVKCVDVSPIGPEGTAVGLSGINAAAQKAIGVHMGAYTVSEYLGYLALAVAAAFACVGLVQLLRRKSLWKVDREILALGVLYIVLGCLYVLFEKLVVNYRPVLLPGETVPAASFPSSHSMLAYVIFGSAAQLVSRYVKKKTARSVLFALCILLGFATVLLRLLSGVHWLTDIVAGMLLGFALDELYAAAISLHNTSGTDQ